MMVVLVYGVRVLSTEGELQLCCWDAVSLRRYSKENRADCLWTCWAPVWREISCMVSLAVMENKATSPRA